MLGNSSPPVVILGMHRSGTTLVSELLGEMGVHTGSVKKGHHDEAFTFLTVNDRTLRMAGGHWAKPEPLLAKLDEPDFLEQARQTALRTLEEFEDDFGLVAEGQRWGWKDPRTMILLPLWRSIYPDMVVVHVTRNGMKVALSLYRREMKKLWRRITSLRFGGRRGIMLPPTIRRGYQLWEIYTRAALEQQHHHAKWYTFKYESLIAEPVQTLKGLSEFLGLGLGEAELKRITEGKVRQGTAASQSETARFESLVRSGRITPDLMQELGYMSGSDKE